jgi:molybdopterin-containing oxidoreductase family iron-sulfur binding subunit
VRELDLEPIRHRLAGQTGPDYWRSLEELAGSDELEAFLHAEFPAAVDGVDRRVFLKLMGASLALAGLGGCTRQPSERIVPAVHWPEETPGKALSFATAMPLRGYATGLLVESHEGRPTKVEGNPDHPASLGATDVFAQAAVLTLYDPDRAQVIRRVNDIVGWERFVESFRRVLDGARANRGAGVRVLTGTVTSPTLVAQLATLREQLPGARWHQWEPVNRDGAHAGAVLAYGEPVDLVHHVGRAEVILSLDADFLASGPDRLRQIRELVTRRRPQGNVVEPSRLYIVESGWSITGSVADDRLALSAGRVELLARAIARSIGLSVDAPDDLAGLGSSVAEWIDAVVADLAAHRGKSLVIAGDGQPAAVHALACAMNHALDNVGKTVETIAPVAADPGSQLESIQSLAADMRAGSVDVVVLLEVNPVYDAPADLDFAEALGHVRHSIAVSLYDDETARLCHWHVPSAHFLESWSDVRSGDGTVTIVQPLIAPLYGGRTPHEILALMLGKSGQTSYQVVREHWQGRFGAADFERRWERVLHDGVVPDTRSPSRAVSLRGDLASALGTTPVPAPSNAEGLEVTFRPHPTIDDGRFANNGWLQECPEPLTKLTWDNAVLLAPETAARLRVANGDVASLGLAGRSVSGAVWLVPGHAVDAVTVHLGYGRTRAGRVGTGRGFDGYRLRTSAGLGFAAGLTVRPTGQQQRLACTQHHGTLQGRHIVRSATVEEFRRDPEFAHHLEHAPALDDTLYPNFPYDGQAWGMAIDLGACVGCNACVVACQAENNIPVVGADQVARGREMQWIRIDRYWSGAPDDPDVHYQPMLCQHCERAPCEVVCPVNATVHDAEGLNLMVYNRCVGTRYCSNNCPYKVRRFNFYLYNDWTTESLKLQRNPDVTVRSRGVMEKCTYCIQRINEARNQARKENRPVRDGEIRTACQQACPAEAIVFGDINDPQSRVARARAEPRNYSVLAELNTRPRTTYLASVRNPNPALAAKTDGKEAKDEGESA